MHRVPRIINHIVNKRRLFDYRLWPTYASAHNNLGTLTVGDQAEQHFLAAIHAQPGHVNAHYNLGQLYRSVIIRQIEKWIEKLSISHFRRRNYIRLTKLSCGTIKRL